MMHPDWQSVVLAALGRVHRRYRPSGGRVHRLACVVARLRAAAQPHDALPAFSLGAQLSRSPGRSEREARRQTAASCNMAPDCQSDPKAWPSRDLVP